MLQTYIVSSRVDIRILTTFIEVSRTRHFGKAAQSLYLTPAAISARIKQLEEYFGVSVFSRHRNNIQLTPAGEKLLPFAIQITENIKHARDALTNEDMLYLAFAATPNAAKLFLMPALCELKAQFSHLAIRTDISNIDTLARQLQDQSIDIGFSTQALKSHNMDNILVSQDKIYLYAIGEQASFDVSRYVHIEWDSAITERFFAYSQQAKHCAYKTTSVDMAVDHLIDNGGCALLPMQVANKLIGRHKISKLTTDSFGDVSAYMVVLKSNTNAVVKQLIEYFTQVDKTGM